MYSILLWVLKCGKCYSNYFFQLTAGNKYNKKQFVNKQTMVLYAKSQKDLNIYTNGNAASERVHLAHLSLDEVYFDCCLRLSVLSHCSTIYWRRNYCFLDSPFFLCFFLPAFVLSLGMRELSLQGSMKSCWYDWSHLVMPTRYTPIFSSMGICIQAIVPYSEHTQPCLCFVQR